MFISNFIRQVPNQIENGFFQMILIGAKAKKKVEGYCKIKCDEWSQSDLWQQYGKPLYERNIKPLTPLDYVVLGGSLCLAALVTAIAVKTLSWAALPLGLSVGALLFLGACAFSRYRVRKYFDRVAWSPVDQIRRTASVMTQKNQRFGTISYFRNDLRKSEFAHLESVTKELDEEIRKFRGAIIRSNLDDKQLIVKTHLAYIKPLVQGHPQDMALIDDLEKEVDKVGSADQDPEALERQKQKLHHLQTLQAISHRVELRKQIDALVKSSEGPTLADSKKAFIEYLEGLQRKLDPSKMIEDLSLDNESDEDVSLEDKLIEARSLEEEEEDLKNP